MQLSATFNDNKINPNPTMTMRGTLEFPRHSPTSSYESSPSKDFPHFLDDDAFDPPTKRGGELSALEAFQFSSSQYTKNSSPALSQQFNIVPGAKGSGNVQKWNGKSLEDDFPTAEPDKGMPLSFMDTQLYASPCAPTPAPAPAPEAPPSSKLAASLTDEDLILKHCPRHVSRTTLCSRRSPREIIFSVDIALKTHDADVKYIKKKHKFLGVVYPHQMPLFFSARLYAGEGDISCLEFKRNSSDGCLAFGQFYDSVLQQLEPHLHHWSYGGEPRAAPDASITIPRFQPSYTRKVQETELDVCHDVLDVMFSMLGSDSVREQKDAIQVLSTFTASKQQVQTLWRYNEMRHKKEGGELSPLVIRLKDLLCRADLDGTLLRSTAAILRHCAIPENMVCTSGSCFGCQVVRGNLCDPLFSLLDAPETLRMKDVQRQLACALAGLTLRHAACVRKSKKKLAYIATLERICGESGRCTVTVAALKTALTQVEVDQ
jgi:hypothetical protein